MLNSILIALGSILTMVAALTGLIILLFAVILILADEPDAQSCGTKECDTRAALLDTEIEVPPETGKRRV